MPLLNWPKDKTKMLSFDELVAPVLKILRTHFTITRTSKKTTNIPYDGYKTGFGPEPDERLSVSGMRYDRERDRDEIDVLVNIIFLLGFEQGKRQAAHDFRPYLAYKLPKDIRKMLLGEREEAPIDVQKEVAALLKRAGK